MLFRGGIATGAAYFVFWCLLGFGQLLFGGNPPDWIVRLENFHGLASLISGAIYFVDELWRFFKE